MSLDRFGTPSGAKNKQKNTGGLFKNRLFQPSVLKLLSCPFGTPFRPILGPQMGSKTVPKAHQKSHRNLYPQKMPKLASRGPPKAPKLAPKSAPNRPQTPPGPPRDTMRPPTLLPGPSGPPPGPPRDPLLDPPGTPREPLREPPGTSSEPLWTLLGEPTEVFPGTPPGTDSAGFGLAGFAKRLEFAHPLPPRPSERLIVKASPLLRDGFSLPSVVFH